MTLFPLFRQFIQNSASCLHGLAAMPLMALSTSFPHLFSKIRLAMRTSSINECAAISRSPSSPLAAPFPVPITFPWQIFIPSPPAMANKWAAEGPVSGQCPPITGYRIRLPSTGGHPSPFSTFWRANSENCAPINHWHSPGAIGLVHRWFYAVRVHHLRSSAIIGPK